MIITASGAHEPSHVAYFIEEAERRMRLIQAQISAHS